MFLINIVRNCRNIGIQMIQINAGTRVCIYSNNLLLFHSHSDVIIMFFVIFLSKFTGHFLRSHQSVMETHTHCAITTNINIFSHFGTAFGFPRWWCMLRIQTEVNTMVVDIGHHTLLLSRPRQCDSASERQFDISTERCTERQYNKTLHSATKRTR